MNWSYWFSYKDGELFWSINISKTRIQAGIVAGNFDGSGYRQVQLQGKKYMVHRIIWELNNGAIPENMTIDHINQNKSDNRIENLRLASHAENCRNRGLRKDSTTGYKGVSWNKKAQKYSAQVGIDNKQKHLGYFDTAEEAFVVYQKASQELHGEFNVLHRKS
jgi:hypothetical protein